MKQLIFSETGAVTIKNQGMQDDGCCIHIKDSILEEAVQSGIINEVANGKSKNNIYFRIGDITLLRVKPEIYVIIDSYINNDKEWIATVLKNYSIYYHFSGRHMTKHTVRVSVPKVEYTDSKGHTVTSNKSINIVHVIHELSNQNLKLGEKYKFSSMEGHHYSHCWDNRLENTAILSYENHKAYHKQHTNASHQLITHIKNSEQLKGFLNFINQEEAV